MMLQGLDGELLPLGCKPDMNAKYYVCSVQPKNHSINSSTAGVSLEDGTTFNLQSKSSPIILQ